MEASHGTSLSRHLRLQGPGARLRRRHLRRQGPAVQRLGTTDVADARRLVDICLDAGVNFFDTADVYSDGASEEILGAALKGRRDAVVLSTKLTLRAGEGANDVGSSRHHLIAAIDAALAAPGHRLHRPAAAARLRRDDAGRGGAVARSTTWCARARCATSACSNFSGWQLMKSLAVVGSATACARYVAQPDLLLADRPRLRVGADAARPRPGRRRGGVEPARLGPPHRQDPPRPAAAAGSRLHDTAGFAPPVDDERLYRVVDALDEIAEETGKTRAADRAQLAAAAADRVHVLIGARNEAQLRQNLGAVGWTLTPSRWRRLDAASAVTPPYPYYPYWNGQFAERSPPPVASSLVSTLAGPTRNSP